MKKLLLSAALMSSTLFALNHDFQRQFGPDSMLYNEPLYFSKRNEQQSKDLRPKKSIRERLRTRIRTEHSNRK